MRDISKLNVPSQNKFPFRKSILIYILVTSFVCLMVSISLAMLDQGKYFFFLVCFVILTLWATVIGQLVTPNEAIKYLQSVSRRKPP